MHFQICAWLELNYIDNITRSAKDTTMRNLQSYANSEHSQDKSIHNIDQTSRMKEKKAENMLGLQAMAR